MASKSLEKGKGLAYNALKEALASEFVEMKSLTWIDRTNMDCWDITAVPMEGEVFRFRFKTEELRELKDNEKLLEYFRKVFKYYVKLWIKERERTFPVFTVYKPKRKPKIKR